MDFHTLREYRLADFTLRYPHNEKSGRIGLELFPTALTNNLVPRRTGLAGSPPALVIDSLAQVKIVGDPYPGAFAQGHTMRNSPSVDAFKYDSQSVEQNGDKTTILTVLKASEHTASSIGSHGMRAMPQRRL